MEAMVGNVFLLLPSMWFDINSLSNISSMVGVLP